MLLWVDAGEEGKVEEDRRGSQCAHSHPQPARSTLGLPDQLLAAATFSSSSSSTPSVCTHPTSTITPTMPPRGSSDGLDFTPILTHYLFLFTSVLSVVSLSPSPRPRSPHISPLTPNRLDGLSPS